MHRIVGQLQTLVTRRRRGLESLWLRISQRPRITQILCLAALLGFGQHNLGFALAWMDILAVLSFAVFFQLVLSREADVASALISGLSVCLLLRCSHLGWALTCIGLAIGSKFFLRFKGTHVFNPTNFGLIAVLLFSDGSAWINPGQWGTIGISMGLIAGIGSLMLTRCRRLDICCMFFAGYGLLKVSHALYHGDPLTIPLHSLQSGSLLVFGFFMITDPRTSPRHWFGRMLFVGIVVATAAYVEFWLYRPLGFFYGLFFACLLTPLLNWGFHGQEFRWRRSLDDRVQIQKQVCP